MGTDLPNATPETLASLVRLAALSLIKTTERRRSVWLAECAAENPTLHDRIRVTMARLRSAAWSIDTNEDET